MELRVRAQSNQDPGNTIDSAGNTRKVGGIAYRESDSTLIGVDTSHAFVTDYD